MSRWILDFFLRDPRLLGRYIGVGVLSALIEFVVFTVTYQGMGWPLLVANSVALALALSVNFLGHRIYTFRVSDRPVRRLRDYLVMQGVAAILNNLLIWLFISQWGWWPSASKLLQIALVFLWNFTFARKVVFAEKARCHH